MLPHDIVQSSESDKVRSKKEKVSNCMIHKYASVSSDIKLLSVGNRSAKEYTSIYHYIHDIVDLYHDCASTCSVYLIIIVSMYVLDKCTTS